MTREDAIKILKAKIDTMEDGAICCNYGNDKEVFDMAIKALEQEPFMNKPCISVGVCEHDKMQMLDNLKAEIMELQTYKLFNGEDTTVYVERNDLLDIIDKYRE